MEAELTQNASEKNGTATVYDALLHRIRRSIGAGTLKPGEFIASEYELAREAGISRVSVRRATDTLMREGLVERRPGKGLFVRPPDRSTRTVQVVVPDLAFDQCVQIVQSAQALGMERGVRVQVYDAHSYLDWDVEYLTQLPRIAEDGAIIVSWHHPRFAESLYELRRQKYPFVLVDERLQDVQVPSVVADNYGGGYAAGQAVASEGHRRIAFIGELGADTVQARLDGLRDAVNDAGVSFDRSRVIALETPADGDWPAAVAAATRSAVDRPDPATAILYGNDQTAAHGYVALRAMGLRIPDDVSVVGFDDNPLCQWLDPPLSTVRQPSAEMGRVAMERLLEIVSRQSWESAAGANGDSPHVVLPTTWIERGSVGKAPAVQPRREK
jgi:DNA-binding LacI/PurR family transcriptional regulator